FRKNEVAGLQLNATEGDVVAFSRNVCESFSSFTERKNVKMTFFSDRDSIRMLFDQDKLEKIFMNLIGNAFKFTPTGGSVDVSLEQVGHDNPVLRIKVADTGIGIQDKDKEHIFERFYQVDDNGNSHPHMGSGIGLSMVSEYVKLHQGTVRVTDNVGCGSVFIIDIPIRHAHRETEDAMKGKENIIPASATMQEEEPAGSSSAAQPAREKPVALVVDDNPDMTDMLKFELERDFDVVTASDGNEALKIIKEATPSIILTDLMMPGMNGIELCRRLKSNSDTVAIPIIILSAKHDLGVKIEGLTLGADDYITKPFNLDVLRLRMKRLVELTAKGATRTLVDPEPESIKITPFDEKFIEKAMKYVSDNIDSSQLSVEELSEHLGMSRVRLYKKIKQITGKTPIEFIRIIRLKRAAQLLRESQLNVSEIAYQTGFNNPKLFSKYFKEEFGILPSIYQSQEGKETNYTV
ncbi:MAG: response regulator, partial [Muribaculaceae bacterium]|nr:response regulator [Muribaculaceae bacterium]